MNKNPRHLGILQKVYIFCDKYNLSHDCANAKLIMLNGIRTLCLKNRLEQRVEDDGQLIKVSVYFLGEFMCTGLLTPAQIKDLSDIGSEIKFN